MSNKPCPRTKNGFHPRSSASCSYCNPGGAGSSATVGAKPLGMDLLHPGSGQPNGTAAEALEFVEKMVKPDSLPEGFNSQTVVDNAHRIYDWMGENGIAEDSVTRESMFDYAAKDTGRDYEEMYNAWLYKEPLVSESASAEVIKEDPVDKYAEEIARFMPSDSYRQALAAKVRAIISISPQTFPDDMTGQTVADNAHRIYDWMRENGVDENSDAREALFECAAEETGMSRDDLTMAWIRRMPFGQDPVPGEGVRHDSFDGQEKDSREARIEKTLVVAKMAMSPAELPKGFSKDDILDNAHRIYDWMEESGISPDSWTRETLFVYAAEATDGVQYDDLYDAFVESRPYSR